MSSIMKKIHLLLIAAIIVLLLLFLKVYSNAGKTVISNDTLLNIKGVEIVTDNNFKKDLCQFLWLDLNRDYKKIYYYLSTKYIEKYYKNIKSADEYYKKESRNEVFTLEYIEVTNYKMIDESNCQIDLIRKDGFEGNEFIKEVRYFFIKEKSNWKLNDSDLIKEISQVE